MAKSVAAMVVTAADVLGFAQSARAPVSCGRGSGAFLLMRCSQSPWLNGDLCG